MLQLAVVPVSRHRSWIRLVRLAASASDTLALLASSAENFSGRLPLPPLTALAPLLTGDSKALMPYCATIGTVVVAFPAVIVATKTPGTVPATTADGAVALPFASVFTVALEKRLFAGPTKAAVGLVRSVGREKVTG